LGYQPDDDMIDTQRNNWLPLFNFYDSKIKTTSKAQKYYSKHD